MDLLPGRATAPTLYGLGKSVEEWAVAALAQAAQRRLIVVGCSVGGSCALEVAIAAPDRVAALVLIGTKANHNPDQRLQTAALDVIKQQGLGAAWARYWAPLFSKATDQAVVEAAKDTALRQQPDAIAGGVAAFHNRRSLGRVVSECQCPVIVVTGEDDVAPGPKTSAQLAASARRGSLHVIPSCGHYVPLEKPDDLRAILSRVINAQG